MGCITLLSSFIREGVIQTYVSFQVMHSDMTTHLQIEPQGLHKIWHRLRVRQKSCELRML